MNNSPFTPLVDSWKNNPLNGVGFSLFKTASGKHALQIVSKYHGKVTVHKHIGTYDDEQQKAKLYQQALEFIHDIIATSKI